MDTAASGCGEVAQGHTPVRRGLAGLARPDTNHVTDLAFPDASHTKRGMSQVRSVAERWGLRKARKETRASLGSDKDQRGRGQYYERRRLNKRDVK